ncbi:putative protein phosphatase 2C 15 [Chlorella vulgaris]
MSVADGLGPLSRTSPCHPTIFQNTGASVLKGEDILLVEHQRPWPGSGAGDEVKCSGGSGEGASAGSARCSCCGVDTAEYSLFAVFDGHNGVAAARLVADSLVPILEERLPQGLPPAATSPSWVAWREDIQLALVETMAELNRLFALKGILAGCTATLVLQYGWLLTCVNLGDSRAILDTGLESVQLTVDHRVATHKGERRRVEAMGNNIAPIDFTGSGPATRQDNGVGPLRIWPGGLCLSRAIGDFDVGDSVIPFPHIMQVLVPPTGARLLVASDGVWDAYEKMNRLGSMLRSWTLDTCPQRLIQSIVRAYGGLRDDTSLIVVDIVPPGKTFPEAVQAAQARNKLFTASATGSSSSSSSGTGGGGGGCGCFGGGGGSSAPQQPAPRPSAAAAASGATTCLAANPMKLDVLADIDVAAVMGLMPDDSPPLPGWYDEFVGEHLFALAGEAMACWQEANERRTGRRPATPKLEASVRAARMGRGTASDELEGGGTREGGGMRRNASVFFHGSTAEEGDDYADKFGHYKGVNAESIGSESPGSSMHSSRVGGDGSVRAGGYRYVDASVRAGNRYTGDYSVRAGTRYLDGGSIQPPPQQQTSFRSDPSIRSGTAALRYLRAGDSAGSGGSGSGSGGTRLLAEAAAATAEEESGRRHGAAGSPFAAAAAAAAQAAASLDGSSSGEGMAKAGGGAAAGSAACVSEGSAQSSYTSAPISVPAARSVSFGVVHVLGVVEDKAAPLQPALDDSPMDFRGGLQGGGTSAPMDTILEG